MTDIKPWNDCSNAEKIQRWRHCEDVLVRMPEHVRQRHWDMSSWGHTTECGTIACAAGHCSLNPWFKRRGLTMADINSRNVEAFFGVDGAEDIFHNMTRRAVEQVIEEVREHIRVLGLCAAMSRAA